MRLNISKHTFRDKHSTHVHARVIRQNQSAPARRGIIGWLSAPIREPSTRDLILAQIELEQQRQRDVACASVLAALVVSILAIAVAI
jgi:hypothetical protein